MRFLPLTEYMRQSAFIVPALVLASSLGPLAAQDIASVADREIVRRQEDLIIAEKLVAKGDKAFADKEYEAAYVNYLDALDRIPAGSASGSLRPSTLDKFSRAAIAYAEHLIATGRYSDAEKVAKTVLLPRYNPTYKPAVQLLANLEQPDYYNKTVTPGSAADAEEVTKLLYEADGYYQTGRYDLALKRYEQVLNIDRYNIAARKGMEQVNLQKSKYYGNAYNETRSRLLWEVDQSWERPVRRFQGGRTTSVGAINRTGIRGTEAIVAKLNRIIIPRIDLQEATVRDAVDFLKQRSKDLDTTAESPGERKGVNIVLKLDSGAQVPAPDPAAPADPTAPPPQVGGNENTRITLTLTNVPLIEALRYLTELSGLKYKIDPYAVSIVPLSENTTDLVTKEYRVPPGFIPSESADGETAPAPGTISTDPNVRRIGAKADAKTYLAQSGVPFPSGSFAQYVPAGSKLIVRNTPDAIDLVDFIVDAAIGVQPTQVEIESKFLEITQNNLKELGFDWLMGPLSIGGGVYGSGGTVGMGTNNSPTSPSIADYPFASNGVPIGAAGGTGGGYPLTGGLRTGVGTSPAAAVSANSIDALIAGILPGANFAAPALFGVSGIFTNPQFQVVIRALDQKKGVDLMSAPKVTTKSGHKAIVRVVREFPYPTEFNPPEPPPPSTGGGSGGIIVLSPGSITTTGVVTPTTPTAFETRNLGVTLEVEPVVGPDGYTIDLNLSPEVVEFDGFVNYGSPIFGAQYNPLTFTIDTPILTDNVINQPVFSTRKVTTSVSIWDGQTVALGGLIREDVQKVQDKVPLLGDVPLAGRLFRSNVDQKIKRNLIIFVTARLMDAEGRPVRMEDETEEIVEPLGLPQEIPPPVFEIGKGAPLK
jgi:general secretion pathway protein D